MIVKLLPMNEKTVNEFLKTPGLKIQSKHIISPDESFAESGIAIFYELDDPAAKDRLLIEQNAEMERLIDIARDVAKDKNYALLKNIAQREIYLFTQYNLSKADAGTVQTLLTPEMRPVLAGA